MEGKKKTRNHPQGRHGGFSRPGETLWIAAVATVPEVFEYLRFHQEIWELEGRKNNFRHCLYVAKYPEGIPVEKDIFKTGRNQRQRMKGKRSWKGQWLLVPDRKPAGAPERDTGIWELDMKIHCSSSGPLGSLLQSAAHWSRLSVY